MSSILRGALLTASILSSNTYVKDTAASPPAPPAPLGVITVSPSLAFKSGKTSAGTFNGTTSGSTLTVSGAPNGFAFNSATRTWSFDGSATSGTGSLSVTETPSVGAARVTVIDWSVTGGASAGGGGGGGTQVLITPNGALLTPILTLAADKREVWPIQMGIDIPLDAEQSTDILVYEWWPLDNPAAVTRTFRPLSDPTPYNVGIGSITAPTKTVHRAKIQGPINSNKSSYWTAPVVHGDATAPSITTAASITMLEVLSGGTARTLLIDVSEPATIALSGDTAGLTRTTSPTAFLSQHAFTLSPDYETTTQLVLQVTPTDLAGLIGATSTLTINVTNDPSDDPVTSGWSPESTYTLSNGGKTANRNVTDGSANVIYGALSNSSGTKTLVITADFPAGYVCVPGLVDSGTGVTMLWPANGGGAFPYAWDQTNPRHADLKFVVNFTARTVTAYIGSTLKGTVNMPANFNNVRAYGQLIYGTAPYLTLNTSQWG